MNLHRKRITVAGKLVQRYAGKLSRALANDLMRCFESELIPEFDESADVVILGAKAKGFLKRIERCGAETISEEALQAAVDAALNAKQSSSPRKPKRPSPEQLHDRFMGIRRAAPEQRRAQLVEAIELAAGSIDFGLTEQAAPVVSSSRILMLLGRQEAELWALPAGDPLESVAQRLDQQTLHSDAPPQIWQAAMRLWVALGHRPEIVWKRFVGALEDQDAIDLLSLSELEAIEPWSAERRVQSLAALPQIVDQVFVVREEILW